MTDLESKCWLADTGDRRVYNFEKQPTFFTTGGSYKLKFMYAGDMRDQDCLWANRKGSIALQTIFTWIEAGQPIAEYPDYPTPSRPIWNATYKSGDTTLIWNGPEGSMKWVAVPCYGDSIRTYPNPQF